MNHLLHHIDKLQSLLDTLKSTPDSGEAWLEVSELADQMGQPQLNLTAAEQAVRLLPTLPRAGLRHGIALNRMERHEEAMDAYRHAIGLDANYTAAWVNLCVTAKNLGKFHEAEAAIRRAFAITGQTLATDEAAEARYTVLHYHLALMELALDDYAAGFAHFRARFHGGTNWRRDTDSAPLWRGEDVAGKTLRITAEQGHGDTLMMARYLPLLKERGARIIFQPHPALARYFTGWRGADAVVPYGTPVAAPYDFHAPVFDLPYRFGTTIDTLPSAIPYLPLATTQAAPRRAGQPRNIGLVWAGQPDNARDGTRSLPLTALAPLFAMEGSSFHNLTRDLKPGDTELMRQHGVTDHAAELGDFADAARLINAMDLVITCDTAAAHLAGGMGQPVWVLLPFAPDWRWGLARDDSPWYPSMRLFRQTERGDWAGAVARVAAALSAP